MEASKSPQGKTECHPHSCADFLDSMIARKAELENPAKLLQDELAQRTLRVVIELVRDLKEREPAREYPPQLIERKENVTTLGRILGRSDVYPDELLCVSRPDIIRYFPKVEQTRASEMLDALRTAGLVEKAAWFSIGYAVVGVHSSLDPTYKPGFVGYFPTQLGLDCSLPACCQTPRVN